MIFRERGAQWKVSRARRVVDGFIGASSTFTNALFCRCAKWRGGSKDCRGCRIYVVL